MDKIRIAVVGAGQFGKNHCRVVSQSPHATLSAIADTDPARAAAAAAQYSTQAVSNLTGIQADAAIVAVPTSHHAEVGCRLMQAGMDVLVEKPMAPNLTDAGRLLETASTTGRILQVGHLERFNPAVAALETRVTLPLFFEIHRMSVFSPRSLDIDVVLDLMIHDIDIVLALTGAQPEEIRAAGISVLSANVDIANVRLQFPTGCIANLTASRVSTEKVRKLRLFQPRQYLSLDYGRQDLFMLSVNEQRQVTPQPVFVTKSEPLQNQFDAFLHSIRTREIPKTSGARARQSLEVALAILDKIKEHSELVSKSLLAGWNR